MSNRAITWAYQQPLKGGPKFVLVTLADMADQEHSCFPGVTELARLTGFGRTAIIKHLDALIDAELITRERRVRKDGSRSSNRYYLAVDDPTTTDRLSPESGHSPREPKSGIRTPLSPESEQPKSGIRTGILEPKVNPQTEPPEETHPAHTPEPDTDHDTTTAADIELTDLPALAGEAPVGFDDFWKLWPRKDAKKTARAKFAIAARKIPAAAIVAAARSWLEARPELEPQFVPHAATWLNQERWDDAAPPAPPPARPPSAFTANLALVDRIARMEAQHEPHRDSAAADHSLSDRPHCPQ